MASVRAFEKRHRELDTLQLREFFRLHPERLFEFGDALVILLDLFALHQPRFERVDSDGKRIASLA